MMALMVGLIIGFLMCIPVGPINVWVVNTLIKHNFRSAFSIALGGSTMDFVYFMVILSGLSLFHFSPSTIITLKVIGVLFLFAFGLKELLVKKQNFTLSDAEEKKTPKATGFFFLGVLIYSSNPTLIATMSGLAAVIKSWKLFSYTFFNYFALSLGLALGSAAWFYVLLKIVNKYQNKIPEKFFINFSRACGALIVLFSLYMAFNVYKENFV
jgi:threonine/homoserine/homoserine lactone efflux protein